MANDFAAPDDYHTVMPRMVVADVVGAVEFLRATFDASVATCRMAGPRRSASGTRS
jgi:hypothetical protein